MEQVETLDGHLLQGKAVLIEQQSNTVYTEGN